MACQQLFVSTRAAATLSCALACYKYCFNIVVAFDVVKKAALVAFRLVANVDDVIMNSTWGLALRIARINEKSITVSQPRFGKKFALPIKGPAAIRLFDSC